MKWRFWQKDDVSDETTIEVRDIVSHTDMATDNTIFVKAKSPEKAIELYDKLKERQKQ